MRVTRRQLKRIIRESMAHPRGDLGQNIAGVEFPILVRYHDASEIAYNQDELDSILDSLGMTTPYSLDSLGDVEVTDTPVGSGIENFAEGSVRITRRQLRQIIKEAQDSNWPDSRESYNKYGPPDDYGPVVSRKEVQQQVEDFFRDLLESTGLDRYEVFAAIRDALAQVDDSHDRYGGWEE